MAEKTHRIPRPPIVAVLGHVDHGKTTLLDHIRKANVASREIGGITQHIGAYQVATSEGKSITFIDTPGHEAYAAMRSQGAQVADIVLLVVAGDDGVKPQTREALAHIKAAGVPFIVVITKTDLPNSQIERVKEELAKEGIMLEGQGGDVVVAPVSGKTGEGVSELLEMINLVAEVIEVSGDPELPLEAVVIESQSDSKRGLLATLIVRNGKITVGDQLTAGSVTGKVKAMLDENGKPCNAILPGQPTQILGFESAPEVGATVVVGGQSIEKAPKQELVAPGKKEDKKLQLIIKADTTGRLEALTASLPSEVGILHKGVGEVSNSDVLLAGSFKALIVAFGVKVPSDTVRLGEEEKVQITSFSLIYEAVEWVNELLRGEAETEGEKIIGKGEIIAEFPYGTDRKIAGIRVTEGKIAKGNQLILTRNDKEIDRVKVESIKQREKDVNSAEKGQECGIIFAGKVDFRVGDVLESTHL